MALNSNIRNVPLLGNVDLTNYHADIHDYEGFVKDNSFFLNKRKVNWWKRNVDTGEFGGIRAVVKGDYFELYKGTTFIGKIKRSYYKLESVEATTWQGDTLESVINPWSASKGLLVLPDKRTMSEWNCYYNSLTLNGNFWEVYLIRATTELWFIKNGEVYRHFFVNEVFNDCDDFSLHKTLFSFCVFNTNAFIGYGNVGTFPYNEPILFFSKLKTQDTPPAYFGAGANSYPAFTGFTYNKGQWVSSPTSFEKTGLSRNSIIRGETSSGKEYTEGMWSVYYPNGRNNIIVGSVNGVNYDDQSYNDFCNTNIYRCGKNGIEDFTNTGLANNIAFFTSTPTYTEVAEDGKIKTLFNGGESYNIVYAYGASLTANFANNPSHSKEVKTGYNYSVKYGKWAINYINNVAQNIAHDFKKLYELEGNEDANGKVLDIDGYNDIYIYFHIGESYFRISIAETTNIFEMLTSLDDVYIIFNTTSYKNAYYNNGDDWFCSCDDWNNRIIWNATKEATTTATYTSRLNDKWQLSSEVLSVSDTTFSIVEKFPVTSNIIDPIYLESTYIDDNYTCPVYEDENGETVKQSYTVYFPKNAAQGAIQSMVKQGFVNADGFTIELDEGDIYTDPSDDYNLQRTPSLLDFDYLVFTESVIAINFTGGYTLLHNNMLGNYELIFLNVSEVNPLKAGDAIFVVNGVEYEYKAESDKIYDYTGAWVANTNLLKYLGFASKAAYFYSDFDKHIYAFEGSNTFRKICSLENYNISFKVYEGAVQANTIYLSSIDLLILNLTTAVLLLYDGQYIILDTGKINLLMLDSKTGTININNVLYSIIKQSLITNSSDIAELIPVKIESQFFGVEDNESNIINDCVYVKIDNLAWNGTGKIKIKAQALQNDKIIDSEWKEFYIKQNDFNVLGEALIKYQPSLQEAKGFKLFIESDFEISSLKIGTSPGAMNQTTKRI